MRPSFQILNTSQLDTSSLAEKKKQKLLKAGYEARLRARKERELKAIKDREEKAEREKQRELEERLDSEARSADLEGWARKLKGEQEVSPTGLSSWLFKFITDLSFSSSIFHRL